MPRRELDEREVVGALLRRAALAALKHGRHGSEATALVARIGPASQQKLQEDPMRHHCCDDDGRMVSALGVAIEAGLMGTQ